MKVCWMRAGRPKRLLTRPPSVVLSVELMPAAAVKPSLVNGLRREVAKSIAGVTLMPPGPNSSARFLVSAATPILRMLPMMEPVERAARPLILMMRPPAGFQHRRHRFARTAQIAEDFDVDVGPEILGGDLQ